MDRSRLNRILETRTGAALALGIAFARSLAAQPSIEHGAVSCLPRGEFTQFVARIDPASDVRAAKLYFRSELYRDFYFVAMSPNEAGAFAAVMPMPNDETNKVVYYIEAVDTTFQTTRSDDREASVSESDCRMGPGAVLFPGSPAIVVGATSLAAPAIPAGFQAAGITGFLTASGAVGGGGIGIGVAVGAAAGAAAGVGVLVATGGGDSATTTTPPLGGGGTSSISTTTSSAPATTTAPSGSTTTSAGSTTSAPTGPASTTSVLPTLAACFEWQALADCKVFFDSCSTPADDIVRYEWRMLGPPVPEPPLDENFTFDFAADPRCLTSTSFNYPVRHTVFDRYGRSANVQRNVTVRGRKSLRAEAGGSMALSFGSQLVAVPRDGRVRGQIAVDGVRLPPSDNSSPSRHLVRVGEGEVRIELTLLTPAAPGSLWELDFSSSTNLVAGSLRAEGGMIAAADDRRLVFRLNGDPGEVLRVRLTVR